MIKPVHDWKVCRCTDCQSIVQDVEQARREGAEDMRDRILALAKKFNVPTMAIMYLKGLSLPEAKFK